MQILLMIVFRIVERLRRRDLGGDSAGRWLHSLPPGNAPGWPSPPRSAQALADKSRTILRSAVVTLLHALRRVVIFPEYLEQLLIADNLRIVDHAHGFSMAGPPLQTSR